MFTICFLTLFHANAIGNDDFILQADSEEHVKDIDEVDSVPTGFSWPEQSAIPKSAKINKTLNRL